MCASRSVLNRPGRRNESDCYEAGNSRSSGPPAFFVENMAESERTRRYPKDGELCLGKTKPEETLVEVCSDSDVQIDRQTWV